MNVLFPSANSQKVAPLWNCHTMLDEGGIFVATNPTVGTAIAMTSSVVDDAATASSTHAQFAPAAILYNNASENSSTAVTIYPRCFTLGVVQVPTSATNWKFALRLDNLNRYSSGGSAITPVNPNPNSGQGTNAKLYFGALVPTALPSSSSRLVAHGSLTSAIPVAGDQYVIAFGSSYSGMDMLSGGTAAKNLTMTVPPVAIPPGWSLSLELWGTSNAAAASFEFNFAWDEREAGL